jgi:anti-sigma factor RsiW
MHCEQVKSLLNEYCEGSLSEAMRARVEAHLRGCAACQREAQFMQAIWRGLAAMPEVIPPADLHARIMTHVRANTRAREAQGRVAFWRWAGAAARCSRAVHHGLFRGAVGRRASRIRIRRDL